MCYPSRQFGEGYEKEGYSIKMPEQEPSVVLLLYLAQSQCEMIKCTSAEDRYTTDVQVWINDENGYSNNINNSYISIGVLRGL